MLKMIRDSYELFLTPNVGGICPFLTAKENTKAIDKMLNNIHSFLMMRRRKNHVVSAKKHTSK